MTSFRCAHISDLHFSCPTWSPSQFFSKRWIGNFNLIFSRRRVYTPSHLPALAEAFKALDIKYVFITGDLSCTSLEEEFNKARQFICSLKELGCHVFVIPGNHDHYTKKAHRLGLFYDYFSPSFSDSLSTLPSDLSLRKDKVAAHYLGDKWWVVGIDTAIATSLFSASGHFSQEVEKNLIDTLLKIPQNHQILLMNHFPVFQESSIRNRLIGKEALESIFKRFGNIRFYLHGHTHRHCVADLRANHLPIILDSGSTAHQTQGSWNLLEIGKEKCTVGVYRWEEEGSWGRKEEHVFHW